MRVFIGIRHSNLIFLQRGQTTVTPRSLLFRSSWTGKLTIPISSLRSTLAGPDVLQLPCDLRELFLVCRRSPVVQKPPGVDDMSLQAGVALAASKAEAAKYNIPSNRRHEMPFPSSLGVSALPMRD